MVAAPASHAQGWICGPYRIAPDDAWLVIVIEETEPSASFCREHVCAIAKARHESHEASVGTLREGRGHVGAADIDLQGRRVHAWIGNHLDQRVTAAHQVSSVGHDLQRGDALWASMARTSHHRRHRRPQAIRIVVDTASAKAPNHGLNLMSCLQWMCARACPGHLSLPPA
jgi:hypothetical protein